VKDRLSLMAAALLLLAAPTVGDIGSCGQEVAELDAPKFFAEKRVVDCQRCVDCDLQTAYCTAACDRAGQLDPNEAFPLDCYPLVHDGEVCLNALRSASCSAYASYVDDVAPTVPTECNFCPVGEQPVSP
jgi:hypothetical protein